jgi:DNA primase
MAAKASSPAVVVPVGEREVRVSNPDRVVFPATGRSPALTKLDVVEYYLAVGDGIMRAVRERPTTLERWPKGVHEGIVLATREGRGGDAFYQKRIPKGAPDWVETTIPGCTPFGQRSSVVGRSRTARMIPSPTAR